MSNDKFKYCPQCGHMMYQSQSKCPQCGYVSQVKSNINSDKSDTTKSAMLPPFSTQIVHQVPGKWVSFTDAFKLAFKRYVDFFGTSSRSEFWWFQLWKFMIDLIGIFFLYMSYERATSTVWLTPYSTSFTQFAPNPSFLHLGIAILIVWNLIALIPSVALLIRRMRDASISNVWIACLLIGCLVPLFSPFAIIATFVITTLPSLRHSTN